jgi:hypothetical protein
LRMPWWSSVNPINDPVNFMTVGIQHVPLHVSASKLTFLLGQQRYCHPRKLVLRLVALSQNGRMLSKWRTMQFVLSVELDVACFLGC